MVSNDRVPVSIPLEVVRTCHLHPTYTHHGLWSTAFQKPRLNIAAMSTFCLSSPTSECQAAG